jgi:hypothetical protein
MDKIDILLASTQNIFSVQDLAVLWSLPRGRKLFESIKYYVRTGRLVALKRGLYALPGSVRKHSPLELAQKIFPLSYISLSTALTQHGISFQFQQSIQSVSTISKTFLIQNQKFEYHKIKEDVFFDSTGLEKQEHYTIASPERAVCDMLYLFPTATFDNLRSVNGDRLYEMSRIYGNNNLEKRIQRLIKTMGEENA